MHQFQIFPARSMDSSNNDRRKCLTIKCRIATGTKNGSFKKKRRKPAPGGNIRNTGVIWIIYQAAVDELFCFLTRTPPHKKTLLFTHLLGSRQGFSELL